MRIGPYIKALPKEQHLFEIESFCNKEKSLRSLFKIHLNGNTLLEGVCIRLHTDTWHEHEGGFCMFMTNVIKCHSLSYVIFNAM